MRTATTIEAASFDRWSQQRDFVVEAEKLGRDVWFCSGFDSRQLHRASSDSRRWLTALTLGS
jgi:hypothetical protein